MRGKWIQIATVVVTVILSVSLLGACGNKTPATTTAATKAPATTAAQPSSSAPATSAAKTTAAPATSPTKATAGPPLKPGVKMPTTLAIIGGSGSGTFSELQATWMLKRITDAFPGISGRVLPGGQEEVIRAINGGTADLGRCGAIIPDEAWKGVAPTWKEPMRNFRLIGHMDIPGGGGQAILTLANSPINKISDLANKKIGVGKQSAISWRYTQAALSADGITFESIEKNGGLIYYGEWPAQIEMMAEGKLDAVAYNGSHPFEGALTVDKIRGIKVIPFTDAEVAAMIKEAPQSNICWLSANGYKSQPNPVKSVGTSNIIPARKDLPNDVVYNMLAALYADRGESYKHISAVFEQVESGINLDLFPVEPIPMHPGAAAYWKDFGVDVSKLWVE